MVLYGYWKPDFRQLIDVTVSFDIFLSCVMDSYYSLLNNPLRITLIARLRYVCLHYHISG